MQGFTLGTQIRQIADFLDVMRMLFRKPDPKGCASTAERDLQRLAETSPHLLDDIGMVSVRQEDAERRLWVRGGYRIEMPCDGSAPVVSRIG